MVGLLIGGGVPAAREFGLRLDLGLPGWAWAAATVLLGPALFYGLVPLLIRRGQTFDATVPPEAFDPARDPPPPEVARFFAEFVAALAPHGFSPVTRVRLPAAVENVSAVMCGLANPVTGEHAAAVALFVRGPLGVRIGGRIMQVFREYLGGTVVYAVNHPDAAAGSGRDDHRIACDWLTSPADAPDLLRVFRAADAAWGGGTPLPPIAHPDEWPAAIDLSIRRGIAREVRAGHRSASPRVAADSDPSPGTPSPAVPPGRYPLTRSGAYALCWKQLWPIKPVHRVLLRGRARGHLREWGLTDLTRPTGGA